MPLRPETRRRRKTAHPLRLAPALIRPGAHCNLPPTLSRPRPIPPPQTEAGVWLVQRCLMAICRNQAHAQVESARGAGRRPPPRSGATSPAVQPSLWRLK